MSVDMVRIVDARLRQWLYRSTGHVLFTSQWKEICESAVEAEVGPCPSREFHSFGESLAMTLIQAKHVSYFRKVVTLRLDYAVEM